MQSVPVNRHCGPELNYVASMRCSGNWRNLSEIILNTSQAILIGPNETEIRILARNREGFSSEQSDVLRIPGKFTGLFSQNFAISHFLVRNP